MSVHTVAADTTPATALTVVPFGDTALLLTVPDGLSPAGLTHLFMTGRDAGLFTEVIPGANTILLVLANPNLITEATRAVEVLATILSVHVPAGHPGPVVRIPVTYDGPDLDGLAAYLGVDVSDVIAEHCREPWTVDFLGFAPGFPYLSNGSDLFAKPRLHAPRATVPAGSVGVAGGQTCIYPSASPGGWNLIGHTDVTLFDPANTLRPALLTAGSIVQFHQVGTR